MKKKKSKDTENFLSDEDQGNTGEKKLKEAAEAGLLELSRETSDLLLRAAKAMKRDVAIGTRTSGNGTEYCPVCDEIAGQGSFYCKYCGQKLREGGRG